MSGEVARIPQSPAQRSSKLSISPEQEAFHPEQIDALKKMNGWKNVPSAELAVFFHQAKRSGLDPFSKQIYLIPRGGNFTIQTSIDGMRLVADRTGRYAGSDRPVFGKDDGDRFAEITVYKLVGSPPERFGFTSVAYESEYSTNTNLWKKMPKTMLAKCAEAQALRKAFPADLSGMYGSEEMDQASPPAVQDRSQSEDPSEVVDAEVVEEPQPKPRPQSNAYEGTSQGSNGELARNHQAMVDQIERLINEAADGFFDDPVSLMERARQSYSEAMSLRRDLHDQLAEGQPAHTQSSGNESDVDLDEDDMAEIDRMTGTSPDELKARRSQIDLLKTLLTEIRGSLGVQKLEEYVGKPISELSRWEADDWIDKLTPEQSEQPEDVS